MSFDLFMVTFRDGFDKPILADAVAARAVLDSFEFTHDPEFSAYGIHFCDGSHLEMYASGLHDDDEGFDGSMFALRGLSHEITQFIYDFSRAAGSVLFPAMEPPLVLVPGKDLVAHLPEDLANKFTPIPIANGQELFIVLNDGFDAWRAFRDRIVGNDPPLNDA